MIIDTDKMTVIDLTHSMTHAMPGWVTHSTFSVTPHKIMDIDGYTVHNIQMNTHHGTHMDAGSHMIKDGKPLSAYPMEHFIGPAVALDFSSKKNGEPISNGDFKEFEDLIKPGVSVILNTGWYKFRGYNKEYLYEWPFLNADGAKYLAERRIKMVGTDGMSIAGWMGNTATHQPVTDDAIEVHEALLKNDVLIIEEMANTDKVLNGKRHASFVLMALPLNLEGLDGSPVRAVALI